MNALFDWITDFFAQRIVKNFADRFEAHLATSSASEALRLLVRADELEASGAHAEVVASLRGKARAILSPDVGLDRPHVVGLAVDQVVALPVAVVSPAPEELAPPSEAPPAPKPHAGTNGNGKRPVRVK